MSVQVYSLEACSYMSFCWCTNLLVMGLLQLQPQQLGVDDVLGGSGPLPPHAATLITLTRSHGLAGSGQACINSGITLSFAGPPLHLHYSIIMRYWYGLRNAAIHFQMA